MNHTENPAERLFFFLNEGMQIKSRGQARDVLEKLLEVKGNSALLLERLSQIAVLPSKIKVALDETDGLEKERKIFLLDWQTNVEAALGNMSFTAPWTQCISRVKDGDLARLEACSYTLRPKYSDAVVEPASIDKFILDVTSLLDDIGTSSLSTEAKSFVLSRLREIRASFENIKFSGSEASRREVEAAMGGLVLRQDLRKELSENKVGKKFFTTLAVASDILSITASSAALTHVLMTLPG